MLQSANAYLYNVLIIGNDTENVDNAKIYECDKFRINSNHSAMSTIQTRGISA